MARRGLGGVVGTCAAVHARRRLERRRVGQDRSTPRTPTKVQALLGAVNIHPDFGSDFGIPFNTVPATQPLLPITFSAYPDESDPGPYPFPPPATAIIEGGNATTCDGDCHMIAVQLGTCQLYEGYGCNYSSGWTCANGAHWDLTKKSQGQRPDGWTSADAGGLPIYAGLARYSEYTAGAITHAIRFTLPCTTDTMVAPATHEAVPGGGCSTNAERAADGAAHPPQGQLRHQQLHADGAALPEGVQEVRPDPRRQRRQVEHALLPERAEPGWTDNEINDLKRVPVSAFEAVVP